MFAFPRLELNVVLRGNFVILQPAFGILAANDLRMDEYPSLLLYCFCVCVRLLEDRENSYSQTGSPSNVSHALEHTPTLHQQTHSKLLGAAERVCPPPKNYFRQDYV